MALVFVAFTARAYNQVTGTFNVTENWKVYITYPGASEVLLGSGTDNSLFTVANGSYEMVNRSGVSLGSLDTTGNLAIDANQYYTVTGKTVLAGVAGDASLYAIVRLGWFVEKLQIRDGALPTVTQTTHFTASGNNPAALPGAGRVSGRLGPTSGFALRVSSTIAITPGNGGPAIIVKQPIPRTVGSGEVVTFSVSAIASGVVNYQWQNLVEGNWIDIPNATDPSFTVEANIAQPTRSFRAKVTSGSTDSYSNAVTLTVVKPPEIRTQPESLDLLAGASISLIVETTEGGTFSYAWYRDNTLVSTSGPAYQVFYARPEDSGSYRVEIMNAGGKAVSEIAEVTVDGRPILTTQPTDASSPYGTFADFTVAAKPSSLAASKFQWYHKGQVIAGATQSTYRVDPIDAASLGTYFARVSNKYGFVDSNHATLSAMGDANFAIAANLPNFIFRHGGDHPWYVTTTTDLADGLALSSGEINHSETSWIETTISGPGIVTFSWRASSEWQSDWLEVALNGTTLQRISNQENWANTSLALSAGENVIRWTFRKNDRDFFGEGEDRGMLDAIAFRSTLRPEIVSTAAGGGATRYVDETRSGNELSLLGPFGLIRGDHGNLLFTEADGHSVRSLEPDGQVALVAGTGTAGFSGDGGTATAAKLNAPGDLALAPDGLYIADFNNNRIRKVHTDGTLHTAVGNGESEYTEDGLRGEDVGLFGPNGLALAPSGALYYSDQNNHCVRKLGLDGRVTTVAGIGTADFSGDGGLAQEAALNLPRGLAFDSKGNLYIADTGNFRIRRINSQGIIETIIGDGSNKSQGDGAAASLATVGELRRIIFDPFDNLYFAERNFHRVRRISNSTGVVNTVIGNGVAKSQGDGRSYQVASLNQPIGLAFDATGDFFVAEYAGDRVRRIHAYNVLEDRRKILSPTRSEDGLILTVARDNDYDQVLQLSRNLVTWETVAAIPRGAEGNVVYAIDEADVTSFFRLGLVTDE